MRSTRSRWGWNIGAVVVLVGGVVLANYGLGVTPTMAALPATADPHEGLPQNWDQTLPVAQRFVVLTDFESKAVRDNETGLVREKTPTTSPNNWKTPNLSASPQPSEAGEAGACRQSQSWRAWSIRM